MIHAATPELAEEISEEHVGFELVLTNFSGPFDVLLSLIARRRMDVTEIALAEVTDEFLDYVSTLESSEQVLENSTAFMVVAATLLELKTARLLPAGIGDTHEELALLEERDLLFARLLQYRAFKQAAEMIKNRMQTQTAMVARRGRPEPEHANVLPQLVFDLTPEDFAAIAEEVLSQYTEQPAEVGTSHLHTPMVSLTEQITLMTHRIKEAKKTTFQTIIRDAATVMVVVVRFLGLLSMYRDQLIDWQQQEPLGEITIEWLESA